MVKFILKRIGTMIIAMFMIILITFTLMHSIPGGPFTNTKGVPEEVTQAMEAKYGLDQPMPVQFVKYLGNLLHGDFGPSYKYTGKTVNDFIATGAPVSAKLGLVTLVFVLLTSIPMGILAALKNGKWQDMLLMAIATIGVTIPSFVIAGEAADGNEAVAKYNELKPDLVTLDITMPNKDGIQALKEIKAADPNATCVMCSAMGQQSMVIDAIQSGAKDFIVKPFQADRVLESIRKVLG